MLNESLWIILLATNFILVILAYKLFGKTGLYFWTAVTIVLANIAVLKTISFFGFVTAMGNILYSSTFLITDILSENHSQKDARKAVWIGFFTLIATTIIMQITLHFTPHSSDFAQESLKTIFGFFPRIAIASLIAYLISQNYDILIYSVIKKYFPKYLWLRNNGSTLVSQLLDNVLFTLIAFYGVFTWDIMFQIFLTSYIMKFIIAIADTPFLYLVKKKRKVLHVAK